MITKRTDVVGSLHLGNTDPESIWGFALTFLLLIVLTFGCDLKIQEESTTVINLESIQVTKDPWPKDSPAWSPDGSMIAYSYFRRATALIQFPLGGEALSTFGRVEEDIRFRKLALSPEGSTIAFVSFRNDTTAIWIIPANGGKETKLTKNVRFADNPSWSPDGSKIAYWTPSGIWISSTNGDILSQTSIKDIYPTWFPDGITLLGTQSIVYSNINVISLVDSAIVPITESLENQLDLNPSWFPDNNKIAFVKRMSTSENIRAIWTIPFLGGEATPLTGDSNSLKFEENPAVSPDGTQLVYDNGGDLFLLSLTEGEIYNLTPHISEALNHPTWSPDGERIACSGESGLKIFRLESNQLVEEVTIEGDFYNPTWSPIHPVYGSHIAVESFYNIFIISPDDQNVKRVMSGAEDYSSYFSVQGGSANQNLVILDGVVIPNLYRFRAVFGGGVSDFNPNTI
ncbi:MAG: hypothetical protein ACE5JB_11655 [bacterium]